LHPPASITEIVPPPRFATYTVRVSGSNVAATGNLPTLMVAITWLHPEVTTALQRAPLNTVTVPSPVGGAFTTYTVSVRKSATAASGPPFGPNMPTLAFATTRHPLVRLLLQAAALMTSTTSLFWIGT